MRSPHTQLHPLVGRDLGRARLAPGDLAAATLGAPIWGPASLLADLALRTSIPPRDDEPLARLAAARDALAAAPGCFAASLEVDPWGTAGLALAMRDELVLGGWQGQPITSAGARVAALTLLDLPAGEPDRLAILIAALRRAPYAHLTLAEPADHWPCLWQRLFERMAALGTTLDVLPDPEPPSAPDSDLALIQRLLANAPPLAAAEALRGDGSIVFLRAETPEPLADAIAALASTTTATRAILRTGPYAPLEAALAAYDLPRLGGPCAAGAPIASAWLPLVLRLARAPFDPEAAIDLTLLPGHGLSRYHVDRLASALSEAPGLTSRAMARVAPAAATAHPDAFARLMAWLTPAADVDAATLTARLTALDANLRGHDVAAHHVDPNPLTADALALARLTLGAVIKALPTAASSIDPGPLDTLLRLLGERAARATTRHEAGTQHRADAPGALLAPVDTLVWWGFADPHRPPRLFRPREVAALRAADIAVEDPTAELAFASRAARHAFLRARRRLVLVLPERTAGDIQSPHPLWSELCGRLSLTEAQAHALFVRAPADLDLKRAPLPTRLLPPATGHWQAPAASLMPLPLSVSKLERILLCPLAAVLGNNAGLRRRATGPLQTGPMLLGRIGHGLVETLFEDQRLTDADEPAIRAALAKVLDAEASYLLRPGRAAEKRHLERVYVRMVRALQAYLTQEGFTVTGCEEPAEVPIGAENITLRTDLRAIDSAGQAVVIDLKWSTRSHQNALNEGRAVQLATYAHALGPTPARGIYFGIMRGNAVCGAPQVVSATWHRVQRTLLALRAHLATGYVPVSGLVSAPPLGEVLGLAASDALVGDPLGACRYCDLKAICGAAWHHLQAEPA